MRIAWWLAVAILLVAAKASVASAADKPMCQKGFDDGQRLRRAHQLLEARTALIPCAQDECSKPARSRCADALREVQKALPSIVVRARAPNGTERLLVDGKLVRERLDDEPIELDPGEHTVRLEPQGIEERVRLVEGVQKRVIELGLSGRKSAHATTGVWRPSPIGVLALVISGAAFAAGIATGVFAVVRADDCKTGLCDNALVDEGLRTANASTAMFVVAALGAAVGAVTLVIFSPKATAQGPATTGLVQLEVGGSACALSITF